MSVRPRDRRGRFTTANPSRLSDSQVRSVVNQAHGVWLPVESDQPITDLTLQTFLVIHPDWWQHRGRSGASGLEGTG